MAQSMAQKHGPKAWATPAETSTKMARRRKEDDLTIIKNFKIFIEPQSASMVSTKQGTFYFIYRRTNEPIDRWIKG
jgi:hypothetical protein